MKRFVHLKSALAGGVSAIALSTGAWAADFDIPAGDLKAALKAYAVQSGVALIASDEAVRGTRSRGAKGELTADIALSRILEGTGFAPYRTSSGAVVVARKAHEARASDPVQDAPMRVVAAASAAASGIESVVVTSSKIKGDIQTVPIAITALSQEQLTSRQIAGGPDLVKEVPNLTFSKTNFTGYNIQIRGIGTQAISVTTDPAVAVAFNDIPFIRNHFFEQEFYDVNQVEVLRGPQGTLYGRNATAGVINLISAKPTDQFEAMASADIGNYHNRRFEGMVNVPIVDDHLDLRVAGEWTKRDGYSFNQITNQPIDGRDLWSGRVTLGVKPFENVQATLVWEHFSENDDRMRTAKQLCKTATVPNFIDGQPSPGGDLSFGGVWILDGNYLSQGCQMGSLYSANAFEVPDGFSLPYAVAGAIAGIIAGGDPYASTTQSRNLRVIESSLNPIYKAKNDVVELNADYAVTPALTFTSQTGYNQDFLWSTEDYNRFNTSEGLFVGPFCDPQLGCSTRLIAQDLSDEHAWQLSQEFRLASNFSGPLNFSIGGNYLHYVTEENYYVFINTVTALSYSVADFTHNLGPGPAGHDKCVLFNGGNYDNTGYQYPDPRQGPSQPTYSCVYIDPNPIGNLDNQGHNYFLSQNPYTLNSYAGFGEAYYNVFSDLKLTGGLRWTEDQKHFVDIPTQLDATGYGYSIIDVVNQKWDQLTGRAAANWTPKFDFTDQTLIYASYAHGYKAGGANPPGASFYDIGSHTSTSVLTPIHPLMFKPEFIDAFELGSKNTLVDGALTLNGDVFYYKYKGYQISEIVDRTAINNNFDAHVKGAEIESTYEPIPGLRLNFAGGWEDTALAKGSQGIDLMDRTDAAHHPDWMVVKPFPTVASNCIVPDYVVAAVLVNQIGGENGYVSSLVCQHAYLDGNDPVTQLPYVPNPTVIFDQYSIAPINQPVAGPYKGFDPTTAPNNGEGFDKNLSGNQLPNAPHFTTSLSAEYTMPVSQDWAATLHGDFYWQSQSMARVFNDRPYDKIRGYSTTNLALILTSADGWQVLGYVKNVFDVTAITGDFLNSDDSGLTTNVFLTDPRLYGVRVTKNW